MLTENQAEFEKSNLATWHAAGYTGKGLRIAVFDTAPSLRPFMRNYASIPLDEDVAAIYGQDLKLVGDGHAMCVAQVLHEVAPEAQLFLLQNANAGEEVRQRNAQWIAANNIDLVSCSTAGVGLSDTKGAWQILRESGIPVLAASGNNGKEKELYPAAFTWTISVGAYEEYLDRVAPYSNWGDTLDCLGYTGIEYPLLMDGSKTANFSGTSCAQPFCCGLLVVYGQWLKEQGQSLTRQWVKGFIQSNCRDLAAPGWDKETGCGLLCLPPQVPEVMKQMKITLQLGSKTACVDGVAKTLDAAPFEQNGRTFVPIRFVAEALGCQVGWEEKTKTVTITK